MMGCMAMAAELVQLLRGNTLRSALLCKGHHFHSASTLSTGDIPCCLGPLALYATPFHACTLLHGTGSPGQPLHSWCLDSQSHQHTAVCLTAGGRLQVKRPLS